MQLSLTINSFDLNVLKTDEGLYIEAEHKPSKDLFAKSLNKDTASGLSKDQFFDLDTIYKVFEDSMKSSNSDKSSLLISEEGKITYTCQVAFGSLTKEFGFNIELEKKEQVKVPSSGLEKLVEEITTKVTKIEENTKDLVTKEDLQKVIEANDARFHALEQIVLEKFSKVESTLNHVIEKMIGLQQMQLKHDEYEHLDLCFNHEGKYAHQFFLSENNKAASSLEGHPSSIFAHAPLPKKKKTKFTLKILASHWIMVGIAPEEALHDHLAYRSKAAVAYSNNGHLYAKGGHLSHHDTFEINLAQYKKNDRVTFEVDTEHGKIVISLNGKHVHEYYIEKEYLQKHHFYPFIYTNREVGCGAVFV